MNTHRFTRARAPRSALKHATVATAIAMVGAWSPAEASTVSGSLTLSPYGRVIDLSERPELAHLQFTRVQITFSAQMTPHQYVIGLPEPDYTLRSYQRFVHSSWTAPDGTYHWHGVDEFYYTRSIEKTYMETDQAFMDVYIGSLAGHDDILGTLTQTTFEEVREQRTVVRYEDTSVPGVVGDVTLIKTYSELYAEHTIQPNKRTLSVTLELDAAGLADLAADRKLNYNLQGKLIQMPEIRVDYTAITPVPEPQGVALALSGLAVVIGAAARRRRVISAA